MKPLNRKHLIVIAVLMFAAVLSAQQLYAAGKPWIGVYMQDVTPDLAEAFGLSVNKGVVINDVAHDSPADKAGLQPKDVILAWNGATVDNSQTLTELVGDSKVGDNAKLTISRGGKEMDVTVTIGERSEQDLSSRGGTRERYLKQLQNTIGKMPGIGVSMEPLAGKLGDYFGVRDGNGALITDVAKDTPAEKAGLKVGDVIVKVDDKSVEGPSDVSSAIHEMKKGDKVDLVVVRDKAEKSFSVEVGEIDSFGSVDDLEQLMPYFHGGMNTPMPMYNYNPDNTQMQQKLDDLQHKLDEMQRKLDQLESKMK